MTLIEQLRLRQQQGNMQPTDPVGVGAQMNIRNAQSDSVTGAGVAPRTNERFANPIQQAIMGEQQGEPLDPNQPIPLFPDREGLRPPPAEPKPTFRETGILGVGGRMFRSIGESLAATQQADIDRMNTIGESQSQMATNVLYGPQSERAQEQRRMTEARRQPAPVQPAMATTQPAPMPISEAAAAEAQTVAGETVEQPQFRATFQTADGGFMGIAEDGQRIPISEAVMLEEEALNRAAMGQLEGATGTQRRFGTEGGFADVPVFGGASSVGDTQAQMRERFGAPTVSGIQAMDAADREARTPESFRQASADRVSRMEAAEASRAAQRGVGQREAAQPTQRDFLEAARSQGLPEPQAKLQAKLQFEQNNAEQERNEQGRVSRETNQRMAEINLERAEQSLRDSGQDAGAIREQVALMREMRQAEGDTIDRMVKFAESLAFEDMPEATQQIISQGIADYFLNMAGSGQQQQPQGGLTQALVTAALEIF